ncbi:MAG: hypothetical protein ACREDP_17290 [Bradyrhizobium sp.]
METNVVGNTAKDRVQSSVDRAAQGAHEALDRVAAKAGPAIDRVRDSAVAASDRIHAKMDDLSVKQDELMMAARDRVRAHPLAIVGGAVLLGLLLGRLTR